jgi:hypothetical protein
MREGRSGLTQYSFLKNWKWPKACSGRRHKHLYEMEIDADDILHRADLRIYDEIVEALKQNNNAHQLVKEFWQGIERPFPRMELTVRKATAIEKLVDDHDK